MKFDKHHTDKIIKSLENGEGRVRAVKAAGIEYSTFWRWMNDNENFANTVKEAEDRGNDKLKDLQKRKILENDSWQSGAWWLERNYPEEFRNRQEVKHEGPVQINITKDESEL